MTRRAFDRFMVEVELGSNSEIGRLTDREFRCLVLGIWPIAAKAEPRGYLAVGGSEARDQDVAYQARCSVAVAKATRLKLVELDWLEFDESEGLWRCRDWDAVNPAPKKDRTNAERQRRWREARQAEHNAVTGADRNGGVTPPEEEVEAEVEDEEEAPPSTTDSPPQHHDDDDVVEEEEEIVDAESMLLEEPVELTGVWAAKDRQYAAERAEAQVA